MITRSRSTLTDFSTYVGAARVRCSIARQSSPASSAGRASIGGAAPGPLAVPSATVTDAEFGAARSSTGLSMTEVRSRIARGEAL